MYFKNDKSSNKKKFEPTKKPASMKIFHLHIHEIICRNCSTEDYTDYGAECVCANVEIRLIA